MMAVLFRPVQPAFIPSVTFSGRSFHPVHPIHCSDDLATAVPKNDEVLNALQRLLLAWLARYQRKTRYRDASGISQSRNRCPYIHNCSDFSADNIREQGAFLGCYETAKRLFWRCTPWGIRKAQRRMAGQVRPDSLEERTRFLCHDLHFVLRVWTPYGNLYRLLGLKKPGGNSEDAVGGCLVDPFDRTVAGHVLHRETCLGNPPQEKSPEAL